MTKKKKTPRKAATRSEAQNESPVVPAEPVPLVVTAPPLDDGDDADESGIDSRDEIDDAVVDPVLGYQSNYVDAGSASTEPGAVPPVDLTGASLESYLASLNDEDLVRFFERLPANSKIASLFKTRGVGVVESKDDDYDDRSLKSYSEASSGGAEKKFFEFNPNEKEKVFQLYREAVENGEFNNLTLNKARSDFDALTSPLTLARDRYVPPSLTSVEAKSFDGTSDKDFDATLLKKIVDLISDPSVQGPEIASAFDAAIFGISGVHLKDLTVGTLEQFCTAEGASPFGSPLAMKFARPTSVTGSGSTAVYDTAMGEYCLPIYGSEALFRRQESAIKDDRLVNGLCDLAMKLAYAISGGDVVISTATLRAIHKFGWAQRLLAKLVVTVVKKAAGLPRMSGGTDLISSIANFNAEFGDPNCFSTGLRLYSEQVLSVTISHGVKAFEKLMIMLNPDVLSPSVGQAMAKVFGFKAIKHVGLLRLFNAFRNLVIVARKAVRDTKNAGGLQTMMKDESSLVYIFVSALTLEERKMYTDAIDGAALSAFIESYRLDKSMWISLEFVAIKIRKLDSDKLLIGDAGANKFFSQSGSEDDSVKGAAMMSFKGACFECGQTGHMKSTCPKLLSAAGSDGSIVSANGFGKGKGSAGKGGGKGSAGKGGGKGDGKGFNPKLKEPPYKQPVWSVVSFEEFDKVYGESVATLKLFSKQDDNDFDFDSVVEEVLVDGATKHRWRSAYGKLFFYSYKDLPNNVVKAAKIVRSAVDNGSLRYDKKLAEAAVSVDASSALKGTRKKQANLAEAEEEGHHLDYFIRENEGNDWIREKIEEMKAKEKAELAKLALVAADQRRADNFNADDEDVGGVYDHDHTPGV